jgi:hypothetical protein
LNSNLLPGFFEPVGDLLELLPLRGFQVSHTGSRHHDIPPPTLDASSKVTGKHGSGKGF